MWPKIIKINRMFYVNVDRSYNVKLRRIEVINLGEH